VSLVKQVRSNWKVDPRQIFRMRKPHHGSYLALWVQIYNYLKVHHPKTQIMATSIRNREGKQIVVAQQLVMQGSVSSQRPVTLPCSALLTLFAALLHPPLPDALALAGVDFLLLPPKVRQGC
jgi:hypothetical protein